MARGWMVLVGSLGLISACGGDDEGGSGSGGSGGSSGSAGSGGSSGASGSGGSGGSGGAGASGGGGSGGSAGNAGGGGSAGSGGAGGNGGSGGGSCDYELGANQVLVIEAEDLPLSDSWQIASTETGFTGSGYIVWTGASQNNSPGSGLIAVTLGIDAAGRYRIHWRNRIGQGTNTTEHNDTWMRIADAAGFYGMKSGGAGESRRYPKPICDDATVMGQIEALPGVDSAACPNGTTSDGWLKVYSSGASDWSWSTRTSDNDAHDIYFEVGSAGSVTLELSARADFHLIDRIVVFEESVPAATAQDTALAATPCGP